MLVRIQKLVEKAAAKKTDEDAIKAEYKAKEKIKPLTQAERLDRIEKILGII